MNSFKIIGNLTADPQLKFANSGKALVRLRVAESRGEGKTSVFYDVTAFEDHAENIADSLHKGDRVIVDGYFSEARTYQTGSGETRVALDVIANDVAPSLRFAKTVVTRTPRTETDATPSTPQYDYAEEPF